MTDPVLYQRLQGSTTFTSTTIQRNRLLRPFPHMSGTTCTTWTSRWVSSSPTRSRSSSHGGTPTASPGNAAFTMNRVTENRTVEEYRPGADAMADQQQRPAVAGDRGRGVRVAVRPGQAVSAKWGVVAEIASGWTVGGTYEYQPGALLNWDNLFFTGDLKDIPKDNPGDRASARWDVRPDEDLVQHRRRVRAGHCRPAGQLPEAGVPVPGRRCSRLRRSSLPNMTSRARSIWAAAGPSSSGWASRTCFNRQHYNNPDLNPTSTNFGQVRSVNNGVMRFITFNSTFRF